MEHLDVDVLAAYVDGGLSTTKRAEVERHIDACSACRSELSMLARVRSHTGIATERTVQQRDGGADTAPTVRPGRAGGDGPAEVAPSSAGSALGTVSPSSYTVERTLSQGGMGRILIATDRRLGRTIAIKETLGGGDDVHRRFLREAEITANLQHPSIVPLYEAGYWPTGEPFYTMKLVEGRPLRQLIDSEDSAAARLRLLPNVLAVADALAYSHARGIIHRDLKPDNILVGEYGETIVIDWGLAKPVDGADEAMTGPGPRASAEDDMQTQAGAVLGTPAYMSPEQARGEVVDVRTDVYALGAVLYHVLGGKPPYGDSRTVPELLDRLLHEAPLSLRELAPDVPPDLLAIVDKAMARAAADRYASARELAEDLRRYTTGKLVAAHMYSLRQLLARWVRRHRTAIVVAAAAVVTIAALGAVSVQRIRDQRTVAEAERTEARARRADVESLLDFMLSDLRKSLARTGRTDALESAVMRARAYFLEHKAGTSGDDLARFAMAMDVVGEVLHDQGKLDEAYDAFERATVLALQGRVIDPGNLRAFAAWWHARASLARDLTDHNKLARAGAALAELASTKIPDNIADDDRDGLEAERLEATAIVAYKRGDMAAARGARTAEALPRTRRAEREPRDSDRWRDLAGSYAELATAAQALGDLAAARRAITKGLETVTSALVREPAQQQLRALQSDLLDRLGDLELAAGDQTAALPAFEQALRVSDELHALDPGNTRYTVNLAISEKKLARRLLDRGDVASGRPHLARATELMTRLHDLDPRQDYWTDVLTTCFDAEAQVAQLSGDLSAALDAARKSEQLRRELLAPHARDPNAHQGLVVSEVLIGTLLGALHRADEAVTALQAGRSQLDELIRLQPDVKEHRADRAAVTGLLGTAQIAAGDHVGGLALLRAAWQEMKELVALPEVTDEWRRYLVMAGRQLAEALVKHGKLDDAALVLAEFMPVVERLVQAQPKETAFRLELAKSLAAQASALDAPATRARAAAALARARTVIEQLSVVATDDPEVAATKKAIERQRLRVR